MINKPIEEYLRMIESWINYGKIRDFSNEFFIKENISIDKNDLIENVKNV
jgi:hypothetical protein